MTDKDGIIRASEIGLYVYCARAWWFGGVLGYRSANVDAMRQGAAQHHAHGHSVETFHRLRRLALILLILAGVALVLWALLWVGR